MIPILVNGAVRQVAPDSSLARLLEEMQLAGKRVAIERNGEIVPRSQYAATQLMPDDQLEIVVAVGGG